MKCEKCESKNIRASIYVAMYIDANDNYKLTKKVLRKKSTVMWYQLHERTSYVCSDCCYTFGPVIELMRERKDEIHQTM